MSVNTDPAAVCGYVLSVIDIFLKHVLQQQHIYTRQCSYYMYLVPLNTFIDGIDALLIKEANNAQQAQLLTEHKIKLHFKKMKADGLLHDDWIITNVRVNPAYPGAIINAVCVTCESAGEAREMHFSCCD